MWDCQFKNTVFTRAVGKTSKSSYNIRHGLFLCLQNLNSIMKAFASALELILTAVLR